MQPTQSKDSREVNFLLHTLRGEQFRHMQNVRQSRTHLASMRSYNSPTLPIHLTMPDYTDSDNPPTQLITPASYAGPAPPKSWRTSSDKYDYNTAAWRTQALSLAASHLGNFTTTPRVPSLALLCLQVILSSCTNSTEFRRDIVPYIPPHLRRDVVRYCAIHCPLPNWKLYSLFDLGNTDGEILIMGPTASLQDHLFIREGSSADELDDSSINLEKANGDTADWESEDLSEVPLLSFILVSARLSTSMMLALPSTLTRMALINLPNAIPLHRLPKICPLLVLLDLSYNAWLKDPEGEGQKYLDKIVWIRWNRLDVLGLRDCFISGTLLNKINQGRWDDVAVSRE